MSNYIYVEDNKIIATFRPMSMSELKKWYCDYPEQGKKLGIFYVMKSQIDAVKKIDEYDENLDEIIEFCISTYSEGRYFISKETLCLDYCMYIDEKCLSDSEHSINHFHFFFKKARGYPYKHLFEVLKSDLYIGYGEGCLTPSAINEILRRCPTDNELDLYVNSRISAVVSGELGVKDEYQKRYERLLERKRLHDSSDYVEYLTDLDIARLESIHKVLQQHLVNNDWIETRWEKEIVKVLPVLFPQYLYIQNKVDLGNYNGHKREADFVLINSSGYIDVMEIKRPDTPLICSEPDHSHNIHVPSKHVSDAAIQLENYLYYLNTYPDNCMKKIRERVKDLPEDFQLKISHPRGLLLLGDARSYTPEQKHALQLIRTHYSRIVDLITYDDLIDRIGYTIEVLKKKQVKSE